MANKTKTFPPIPEGAIDMDGALEILGISRNTYYRLKKIPGHILQELQPFNSSPFRQKSYRLLFWKADVDAVRRKAEEANAQEANARETQPRIPSIAS